MMPHEEAVEKLKEALKIAPDRAELWASWGVALLELKQFEEAAEKFQKAVELQSDFVPALYGWGIALKAQGKEEEAGSAPDDPQLGFDLWEKDSG